MQQRTKEYLLTAERNRDLARDLAIARLKTPSSDWAAVIAFYAALDFVHAYLFEKDGGREPRTHQDRRRCVETVQGLLSAETYYADLYDLSLKVRYQPRYRINQTATQQALDDMNEIERIVRKGLGL